MYVLMWFMIDELIIRKFCTSHTNLLVNVSQNLLSKEWSYAAVGVNDDRMFYSILCEPAKVITLPVEKHEQNLKFLRIKCCLVLSNIYLLISGCSWKSGAKNSKYSV